MSDLDKEELEATKKLQSSAETAEKTADETENEIEKIIQFMINDNYNISFISSIRSLLALYKTYLSLYNKEKETSHFIQSQLDIRDAQLIEEKEKNKMLDYKNAHEYRTVCKERDTYWEDKIREIIKKLDVDIERNNKRRVAHTTIGSSESWSNILIVYSPETIKSILNKLLEE